MKIYLATPVNGRKEKTLREKMRAANKRLNEIKVYLRNWYPEAEFYTSFDIISVYHYMYSLDASPVPESVVMGKCIEYVMQCDMIVLDDGWECSQGCTVERFVAMQYGKQVKTINNFKLAEQLKK